MGVDFGIQFIKRMIEAENYYYSDHAQYKMGKLSISDEQVVDCILHGELIETQAGRQGENPRILFYNGHSKSFYVVVTISLPNCLIISVIDVDWSEWEKNGNTIRRK